MSDRVDLSGGPPPIPLVLVEYLESVYPDRFPTVVGSSTEHIAMELMKLQGARGVVAFLRHHADAQAKRAQPTTTHRSPF